MLSEKKTQKYTVPLMDLRGLSSSHRRRYPWYRRMSRYLRRLYHGVRQMPRVLPASSSVEENHLANRVIWAVSLLVLFIAIIKAYFS